jgi:hypothetical protein
MAARVVRHLQPSQTDEYGQCSRHRSPQRNCRPAITAERQSTSENYQRSKRFAADEEGAERAEQRPGNASKSYCHERPEPQ